MLTRQPGDRRWPVRHAVLQVVETEPSVDERHQLPVEHDTCRDLHLRSVDNVGEGRRQVCSVARPEPDATLAYLQDRAVPVPFRLPDRASRKC